MKFVDSLRVKLGRWALRKFSRGYSEVVGAGRQMSDWILSGITSDADLQANWPQLVQQSRDLFKLNPYVKKFVVDLVTNVFGAKGVVLQMKIKEEADRVVFAAEKSFLEAKQRSRDALVERAQEHGITLREKKYFTETTTGANGSARATATIKAGEPDVFANNLIERAWKRWQQKENCTVGRRHSYAETRHQRLKMCFRDGDVFIRHVRNFDNEFGYAIQIIAAEWIDHSLNKVLPNQKNYIKMGIEYDEWGAIVAYHVIKRKPGDWLNQNLAMGRWSSAAAHERIVAADMIQYCLFEDSENGRGAPAITCVMSKLRHLDKYAEAEVISARAEACKGGHYEATMSGLDPADLADRIDKSSQNQERLTAVVEPAMWKILPFGYTAKAHDPKHPNGNFSEFRKDALREICAGVGDQYNILAGDLEGVNYSSMRAGSLDIREWWMLLQEFDINTAEIPIFTAWLEMALMKGAIPLPMTKFEKFNQPQFQGRRWPWVDPLKDAKADDQAIASYLTSRTRICNENGDDFEEIVEEQALEKILLEEAGLTSRTPDPAAAAPLPEEPDDDEEDDDEEDPKKPAGSEKELTAKPARRFIRRKMHR